MACNLKGFVLHLREKVYYSAWIKYRERRHLSPGKHMRAGTDVFPGGGRKETDL